MNSTLDKLRNELREHLDEYAEIDFTPDQMLSKDLKNRFDIEKVACVDVEHHHDQKGPLTLNLNFKPTDVDIRMDDQTMYCIEMVNNYVCEMCGVAITLDLQINGSLCEKCAENMDMYYTSELVYGPFELV